MAFGVNGARFGAEIPGLRQRWAMDHQGLRYDLIRANRHQGGSFICSGHIQLQSRTGLQSRAVVVHGLSI